MFVLDSEGNIREGLLVTNQEKSVRDQLVALLHEKLCRGYSHSDYSRRTEGLPKCEVCANIFIAKFELKPRDGVDLAQETAAAESENAPKEMEA